MLDKRHDDMVQSSAGGDTVTASKAKVQANARYNLKTYDVLTVRILKAEAINDRIAAAVNAGHAKSKAEYVLQAINDRLRSDGFGND